MHRYPSFEEEAIKQAGIRTIIIREMQKPSSQPVFDYSIRFKYFFDQNGHLIGYRKTYPGYGGRIDTNEVKRIFVGDYLAQESEKLGAYQRREVYTALDSITTKRTISTRRGEGEWEKISQEKITRQSISGGDVQLIGGLKSEPYQRVVSYRNEANQITSREVWNGSRMQSVEMWEYQNGDPRFYRYKDVAQNEVFEYEFPSTENLEGSFCTRGLCKRWSIVNHENGWPKGWILMNPETQDVEIWEFDYRYW